MCHLFPVGILSDARVIFFLDTISFFFNLGENSPRKLSGPGRGILGGFG